MVSKNQIKLITSLHHKKYRLEHGLFIAEGVKVVQELILSNFVLKHLLGTEEVVTLFKENSMTIVTPEILAKLTALASASSCLAVFEMPPLRAVSNAGLQLALDTIRDPGNLGTIIRMCDWFGISTLYCSDDTVDVYNPKVIQATMGSIARVNVVYGDLEKRLSQTSLPVLGTFMDGENIYTANLPEEGIIVMGNEANGISETIEALVTQRLSIPRFGELQQTESLNVAVATAITLSELRRRMY